ncbi:MAG TPA: ABC transporter ATP-binding protein [Nitrospira sp.]|nr:ABC transporter ATP-binding protein [Nitrospira sp.]
MIEVAAVSMRLTAGGRLVTILDDVTFDIPAKQMVAVVGPSGSGKSTLLGLIAGLDQPTSGSIRLDGVDITKLSESELARYRRARIGYIFQSFHLIPTLTAKENVSVPLELSRFPSVEDRAAELLDAVGLGDRMHHYPVQLSGGEQQRVAVARAFACRPSILLADEPTGNLDSATGDQVLRLILALQRDQGTTLVLVTHDPAVASTMQRVIALRDGRIASDQLRESSSDGPEPRRTSILANGQRTENV